MGPFHRRSHSAARLQAVTAPLTQAASGERDASDASDARRVKKCRDCDQLETSRQTPTSVGIILGMMMMMMMIMMMMLRMRMLRMRICGR